MEESGREKIANLPPVGSGSHGRIRIGTETIRHRCDSFAQNAIHWRSFIQFKFHMRFSILLAFSLFAAVLASSDHTRRVVVDTIDGPVSGVAVDTHTEWRGTISTSLKIMFH